MPRRKKTFFVALAFLLTVSNGAFWFADAARGATPDVFRSWFTPPVVPTNFPSNVRFEAEITGGPSSVVFRYNGVDRPMFDNGQVFFSNEVSLITISNVIAAQGARIPVDTSSQRIFRCATIILSEQLLDPYAMSLYDFFARRIEGKQPVAYVDGLAGGTANPWFVATGGRSVMYLRIADETPVLAISQLTNRDLRIDFAGKAGIRYQLQRTFTFANWSNVGSPITTPVGNLPLDVATNFTQTPAAGTNKAFYRVSVTY